MPSQRFFLYRRGAPCAFQLAELRYGSGVLQMDKITTHTLPSSLFHDSWNLQTEFETIHRDVTFLQQFMNSDSQYIMYSTFVMKSSRYPSESYRIINVQGVSLPRRGSIEVPQQQFSSLNLGWSSVNSYAPETVTASALLSFCNPQNQELPQLCQYVAQIVAKHHLLRKEMCPIDLEFLTSYSTLLVPICGHVCGPNAEGQTRCPTCREPTDWSLVNV